MTEQQQKGSRPGPAAEEDRPEVASGPGRPLARRRAVLSVADKQGIAELGRALHRLGWELVSTGGTARVLEEAGLPVTPVQAVTGFPELLEGRVKTLHPALHAGILARRRRPDDMAALAAHGIVPVDLVVVNLYPFAQAAAAGVAGTALLEEIDIGGPALIRAAAKNWPHVAVVVDPADYPEIVAALAQGGLPAALRHRLAVKAFAHTAAYDAVIAQVLAGTRPEDFVPADRMPGEVLPLETERPAPAGTVRPAGEEAPVAGAASAQGAPDRVGDGAWPQLLVLPLRRESVLRYGENPHQAAAVYRPLLPPGGFHTPQDGGAATGDLVTAAAPAGAPGGFVQRGGKPMSYNNWLDTLAAWRAVQEFALPAAVAVKHATPCGIGAAPTPADAFRLARDADPESIFGGIVAFNRTVDEVTARLLAEIFLEVVVAPGFSREALNLLAGRKNLRILEAPGAAAAAGGSPHPGRGTPVQPEGP